MMTTDSDLAVVELMHDARPNTAAHESHLEPI
jgi:hypothetical protein